MMMAKALLVHNDIDRDKFMTVEYKDIIRSFLDRIGVPYYYSFQSMCATALRYGKIPGEFIGPASASCILRDLAKYHRKGNSKNMLDIHVCHDRTIVIEEVNELKRNVSLSNIKHEDSSQFDPLVHKPPETRSQVWNDGLLLIINMRLGVDSINPEYFDAFCDDLRSENCVGALGGHPSRALYFVGTFLDSSGSKVIALDPHVTHPSLTDDDRSEDFPSSEFQNLIHSNTFLGANLQDLDATVSFGFYFKDAEAFRSWIDDKKTKSSLVLVVENSAGSEFYCNEVDSADINLEKHNDGSDVGDDDGFILV